MRTVAPCLTTGRAPGLDETAFLEASVISTSRTSPGWSASPLPGRGPAPLLDVVDGRSRKVVTGWRRSASP
jgi:hypothetical protein